LIVFERPGRYLPKNRELESRKNKYSKKQEQEARTK
jgi:hypothetical protein